MPNLGKTNKSELSKYVRDMVLEKYKNESVGYSSTANGHIDIYLLN